MNDSRLLSKFHANSQHINFKMELIGRANCSLDRDMVNAGREQSDALVLTSFISNVLLYRTQNDIINQSYGTNSAT
jgi:hypothetical protein